MLFHLAPPQSQDKRDWWQRRYGLERRLGEIRDRLEALLATIGPLLPQRVGRRCLPMDARPPAAWDALTIPPLIDRDVLYARCMEGEVAMQPSLDLLNALGLSRDDAEVVLQTIRPCIRGGAEEDLNPFVSRPDSAHGDADGGAPLLMLVPDKYAHDFCWEVCRPFSDFCVVRSFADWLARRELRLESIAAILNPGGDLKRTEEALGPLIAELADRTIVGRAPSAEEMRAALGQSDLVMYFGHGSGEAYLPRHEISRLNPCAGAFLFGCSSGRLRRRGDRWDPEGALMAFRQAQSPLVLCNLWDVTDRDIDKLTVAFLTALGLGIRGRAVEMGECMRSLQLSRGACLLRLLNGAAPVLYIQ